MTTADSPPPQTQATPQAQQPEAESLRDRLLRKGAGLMALPDVIHADNLQRLQRLGQQRYAKVNGLDLPTDDEMAIHIGDVYQGPASQGAAAPVDASSPAAAPATQPPSAPSGLSKLARAGVLAATLGSGAAIPLGVNAVSDWLAKPAVQAAAAPAPSGWQLQVVPPDSPATE